MNIMNKEELMKINGGGFSLSAGLIFGGILTFLIGLFDGYVRPLACK